MVNKGLRFTVSTIALLLMANFSNAQSNYFKLSWGLGAGPNYSFTDVYKGNWGYTAYGTFDVNLTPFVTAGIEAQYGMVQGGDIDTDPHNRQYINHYTSVTANVKFMLGEFVKYDRSEFLYSIRGLYAGFGVGAIKNNIVDIVRVKPFSNNYVFPGEDKSINLAVPLNLGINFFINDGYGYTRYVINLNAQSNVTLGEGLDGYNDSSAKFENYSPDIYNTYSVGVKYFFGNIKSYRKTL